MTRRLSLILLCLWISPRIGAAQALPGYDSRQFRIERIGDNHVRLIGAVEIEQNDWKFFADEVELFTDTDRLLASGNVVYTSPDNQIAADRVDFNTGTQTGTFYVATGTVSIGDRFEKSLFGTQEPDAYFYGETIEKLGPRRYRITDGGFTTCVQPTPRWEMTSSSVTVTLDEYALLKNTVLTVKGVPLFYLPVMYYPIQEDDRATGFLIPAYGSSTLKGQSLSNAFFWAITRSQDATIMHDWFSTAGQGVGGEYRYVGEDSSGGNIRGYLLKEPELILSADGDVVQPARQSFQLTGDLTQAIGSNVQARGRVDYFSDVTVQQTYHADVLESSRRERRFVGNVQGNWGSYTLSGTMDWNETFFDDTESTLNGSAPRVSFTQGEQPLVRNWPIYVSLGAEYATLLREGRRDDFVDERNLTRMDVNPTVRVPFTKWPFLTVNSALSWRGTYWTERFDPEEKTQIEESIGRQYFDLESRITGPVLTKVWDTPSSGYAERFKHIIEPTVTFKRLTAIDNFDEIVQLEGSDSVVGSATQIAYGIVNRFLARRRAQGDAREILSISLTQSFYTDARAAQFDPNFRTSFNGTPPSRLTPVALLVRGSPTEQINASVRAEYDTRFGAFREISADGTVAVGSWLQTTAGWSQRRFIQGLSGFNRLDGLDHYLNAATNLRTPDNVVGGFYTFNYDVLRSRYLQQRIMVYYNTQCCGVTVAYQNFNLEVFGGRAHAAVDNRFNISFTLAGIGSFANVFGMFGGTGDVQ
ncbi:MAG TPA: putative LPS assembly protein LptD [Vicinamibacterales bacterium]|nr:hypothetical protein [Acidobacteriota bacterium]HJO39867.1 putative LPS assembly protein LptD [Vicinamibacterales bacterium]|tara:strand:- start:1549 stop:3819 length:2271 start_codon:yes stop_codon:yes gene_type:complete